MCSQRERIEGHQVSLAKSIHKAFEKLGTVKAKTVAAVFQGRGEQSIRSFVSHNFRYVQPLGETPESGNSMDEESEAHRSPPILPQRDGEAQNGA